MSAFDPKWTWHVYRHAMTEFLFDLNQIQNFRLQLSSMVFYEAGVIGFQVRVFSALNVGLTCRLGSLSPINFFGKRWSDGSVQVLNWIALNS